MWILPLPGSTHKPKQAVRPPVAVVMQRTKLQPKDAGLWCRQRYFWADFLD